MPWSPPNSSSNNGVAVLYEVLQWPADGNGQVQVRFTGTGSAGASTPISFVCRGADGNIQNAGDTGTLTPAAPVTLSCTLTDGQGATHLAAGDGANQIYWAPQPQPDTSVGQMRGVWDSAADEGLAAVSSGLWQWSVESPDWPANDPLNPVRVSVSGAYGSSSSGDYWNLYAFNTRKDTVTGGSGWEYYSLTTGLKRLFYSYECAGVGIHHQDTNTYRYWYPRFHPDNRQTARFEKTFTFGSTSLRGYLDTDVDEGGSGAVTAAFVLHNRAQGVQPQRKIYWTDRSGGNHTIVEQVPTSDELRGVVYPPTQTAVSQAVSVTFASRPGSGDPWTEEVFTLTEQPEVPGVFGRELPLVRVDLSAKQDALSVDGVIWSSEDDEQAYSLAPSALSLKDGAAQVSLDSAGVVVNGVSLLFPDEDGSLATQEWVTLNLPETGSVQMRVDSGQIQWRPSDDDSWSDLVSTASLTGPAGPAVELRVSGGYIQSRPVGGSTWSDVIATSALTGPAGPAVELQVSGGYIQSRPVGGSTWSDVIATSALKGDTGPQGPQGPKAFYTGTSAPADTNQLWIDPSDTETLTIAGVTGLQAALDAKQASLPGGLTIPSSGRLATQSYVTSAITAAAAPGFFGQALLPPVGGSFRPFNLLTQGYNTVTANVANFTPYWVTSTVSIDQISIWSNVAGVGGTQIYRMEIWGATSAGLPDFSNKIATGTVDATSGTGRLVVNLASAVTLQPGLYWGMINYETTGTVTTAPQPLRIQTGIAMPNVSIASTNIIGFGYFLTGAGSPTSGTFVSSPSAQPFAQWRRSA